MKIPVVFAFMTIALAACSGGGDAPAAADIVFLNGTVLTMDDGNPEAEAVAVVGNKITYVGSADGVSALIGDDTEVIDATGKMILPGFVSGHDHIIAAAWLGSGVPLGPATNKDEALDIIRDYAEANPDLKIVFGMGWSADMLGGWPTMADLDAAVSDRPTFMIDFTGHEAWLNTVAMQGGNITKDTPDSLPGTTYWRRDDNGIPTGVGMEFQWTSTFIGAGGWDPETMIPSSVATLHDIAVKSGMTAFLTPGAGTPNIANNQGSLDDFEAILGVLQGMHEKGELNMRAVVQPWFKVPEADPVETTDLAARLAKTYSGDNVRVGGVKIHPESGWLGRGAPMLENYPGTDAKGNFGVSPERSIALVAEANKRGLDVAIHVEGNASVRAAIDAFEASMKAGHTDSGARNTLHHLLLTHPDDYQRIIDLDISVNATPQFSTTWSGQKSMAYEILGEDFIQEQFGRYSDLAHEGVRISISADYPSTPAPMIPLLYVLQTAVTLQDPDDPDSEPFPSKRKPLTLEQGLRAITIDAAWFLHMEDKIGSLEVGKYADIVVLEKDLREVDLNTLKDVKVLGTMMDGNFTHRDGI